MPYRLAIPSQARTPSRVKPGATPGTTTVTEFEGLPVIPANEPVRESRSIGYLGPRLRGDDKTQLYQNLIVAPAKAGA